MISKRLILWCGAVTAGLTVAGCGQLKNTITAANPALQTITLALPQQPNANYSGIYEAQALGYLHAVGINLQIELPSSVDPATRLEQLNANDFQVTLASAPSVIQIESRGAMVVAIGAVVQGALSTVVTEHAPKTSTATTTGAATSTTNSKKSGTATNGAKNSAHQAAKVTGYKLVADNSLLATALRNSHDLPSYAGLVLVAREDEVATQASLLRRLVQAIARGYQQVRADPVGASKTVAAAIGKGATAASLLVGLNHAAASFFPSGNEPWGFQQTAQWQQLTSWLRAHHQLDDVASVTEPFTNELLAGQGVK